MSHMRASIHIHLLCIPFYSRDWENVNPKKKKFFLSLDFPSQNIKIFPPALNSLSESLVPRLNDREKENMQIRWADKEPFLSRVNVIQKTRSPGYLLLRGRS